MQSALLRTLAVAFLTAFCTLSGAGSATANTWGAWKWPGADTIPKDCLAADTVIIHTSPYTHSIAAANSCGSVHSEPMEVLLQEFNSSGALLQSCQVTGTNYAQCSVKHAVANGDYWNWDVFMGQPAIAEFGCSNKGFAGTACWQSSD